MFNKKLNEKVIICGVCRDIEKKVPLQIKIMETIGGLFEDYHIIIYQNNSIDSTAISIRNAAYNNKKITFISENIDENLCGFVNKYEDNTYFRPEKIARARNIVQKHVMSDEYNGFNYVIWMDMDSTKEPEYNEIIETFNSDQEWDAVFAYGVAPNGEYWDWYALRDDNIPIGSELLGDDWWFLDRKKMGYIANDAPWYPVYSAFGGMGIYKKEVIKNCKYSALITPELASFYRRLCIIKYSHPLFKKYHHETNKLSKVNIRDLNKSNNDDVGIYTEFSGGLVWRMSSKVYSYPTVCEHVPFHANMIVNGHDRLYINPRLKFYY